MKQNYIVGSLRWPLATGTNGKGKIRESSSAKQILWDHVLHVDASVYLPSEIGAITSNILDACASQRRRRCMLMMFLGSRPSELSVCALGIGACKPW